MHDLGWFIVALFGSLAAAVLFSFAAIVLSVISVVWGLPWIYAVATGVIAVSSVVAFYMIKNYKG